MNSNRRKAAEVLKAQGKSPKEAYDLTKGIKGNRKKKVSKEQL